MNSVSIHPRRNISREKSMASETDAEKVTRFETALTQLIGRIAEDRYVLAVVVVGSLSEATIWHRESLRLWIIEADGVSRRLQSDGHAERIFRILVEDGINIHAEVIPRSRFKQMVEGTSRTAFSCNFFAERKLVYSKDPSIDTWFDRANTVATKDQENRAIRPDASVRLRRYFGRLRSRDDGFASAGHHRIQGSRIRPSLS